MFIVPTVTGLKGFVFKNNRPVPGLLLSQISFPWILEGVVPPETVASTTHLGQLASWTIWRPRQNHLQPENTRIQTLNV